MNQPKINPLSHKSPTFKLPISRLKRNLSIALCSSLLTIGVMKFLEMKAEAAETIILKYGIFRESISVSELRTFADTGELSPSLGKYLKRVDGEPDDLRFALRQGMPVDPVLLSKTLNSIPGEFVLSGVSQVIHTPSDRASEESLRSAIVTSALEDNEIQVIEIIENYPTDEVHVEGDHLIEAYNNLSWIL